MVIGLEILIKKEIQHFFLYSVHNDKMLIQDNLQISCGTLFKRVSRSFCHSFLPRILFLYTL